MHWEYRVCKLPHVLVAAVVALGKKKGASAFQQGSKHQLY